MGVIDRFDRFCDSAFVQRIDRFFDSAFWKHALLPCIAIAGAAVMLKDIEYNDRMANLGTAARVEIIRRNYEGLRDYSERLRLWQSELDQYVVARVRNGAGHLDEAAYELLRGIEGKLHFLSIADDGLTSANRLERFSAAVERAKRLVDLMLTCLQTDERDAHARDACEKLVGSDEFRPKDPQGRAAIALHLIDQVAIELLRLTPERRAWGLLAP